MQVEGNAVEGEAVAATAKLTNPLPVPLQKGRFLFEGGGLEGQAKVKLER